VSSNSEAGQPSGKTYKCQQNHFPHQPIKTMSRPKSSRTLAAEAVAKKSGLSIKYIIELHRQGMPLQPIEAALQWIEDRPVADRQEDSGNSTSALRREKIRLTQLQAQRLQIEIEARRNELISRAQVVELLARIGSALNAGCRKLENEIPPKLLGLPLSQSIPKCKTLIRDMQSKLADSQSEFWKAHPEKE
jgi:phage terminase Nu1 subunit (DNA packaging protein)